MRTLQSLTLIAAGPAALWTLLSDGDVSSWLIGIPAVVLAAWALHRLTPQTEQPIAVWGLVSFVPYFLLESLRGGLDVALRTVAPRLRIAPGFTMYRSSLRRHDARVFFTNCVSLLPGSLAADLRGDRLELHLLDVAADPTPGLRRLERAVLAIFPEDERTEGAVA